MRIGVESVARSSDAAGGALVWDPCSADGCLSSRGLESGAAADFVGNLVLVAFGAAGLRMALACFTRCSSSRLLWLRACCSSVGIFSLIDTPFMALVILSTSADASLAPLACRDWLLEVGCKAAAFLSEAFDPCRDKAGAPELVLFMTGLLGAGALTPVALGFLAAGGFIGFLLTGSGGAGGPVVVAVWCCSAAELFSLDSPNFISEKPETMLDAALDRRRGRVSALVTAAGSGSFGSGRSPNEAMVVLRFSPRVLDEERDATEGARGGAFAFLSRNCIGAACGTGGTPMPDCRSLRTRVASALSSSCRQLRVCRSLGMISLDSS